MESDFFCVLTNLIFILYLTQWKLAVLKPHWKSTLLYETTFRYCFRVGCCTWDGSHSCTALFGCILTQRPIRRGPIRWRRIGCAWTGWQTLRGQSSGRSFSPVAVTAQTGPALFPHICVCLEQGDMFLYFLFHSNWSYITLVFEKVCRISFDLDVLKLPSKSKCNSCFLYFLSE